MTPIHLHCDFKPGSFPEIRLAGSRSAFTELAALLPNSQIVQFAPATPARPYPIALGSLQVVVKPGARVRIAVEEDRSQLHIEGDMARLKVLADNLRGLATEGRVGEHQHIEYFQDHFFLDETSTPLVLELEEEYQ